MKDLQILNEKIRLQKKWRKADKNNNIIEKEKIEKKLNELPTMQDLSTKNTKK